MSGYDSYDEDSDDYGILKKALHVELPKNFDPNKIPETGEEYLQHVMYERNKCETWLTVDIDRNKFKDRQTFKVEVDNGVPSTVPKNLLPSTDWQTNKIEDFIRFRRFVQSKLTQESTVTAFEEAQFIDKAKMGPPKFSEITCYAQAGKIRMLQIVSKHLDTYEKGTSFGANLGSWIYAILVLLEKPLSPSSCHTMREFAKRCLILRSNLAETAEEELYVPLNLFVCIVARFFNQLDLADS